MGRFDGVLLASDFDNTLIYTEDALRSGAPVPPLSARNREALEGSYRGRPLHRGYGPGPGGLYELRRRRAHERPVGGVQRRGHL